MPDVTGHTIVEPIGSIIFYQHIPLDKSYEHSIKYTSQAAFDGMLGGYNNTAISAQSYSRLTNGSVRVEKSISYLQNCNYMRISDIGFLGGKVYYAFIDGVEYVNNETVDVFFTIDVLMTYWKDFTVPANFVEREHCALADDVVGKNIVPESFELGEYLVNDFKDKSYATGTKYNVICYVPNLTYDSQGSLQDSKYVVYQGGNVVSVNIPTADLFKAGNHCGFGDYPCCLALPATAGNELAIKAINMLISASCTIICAVQIYGDMYTDNWESTTGIHTVTIDEGTSFKKYDGTVYSSIKNKKLLNAPFRKLVVSNNGSQNAEYNWEMFSTRNGDVVQAEFVNHNMFLPNPIGIVFPRNYRGKLNDFENSVTLEDFPQLNYSTDSYASWWAQNKANYGLSLATGVLSTGLMIATSGMGGTAVTSASKMIDDVTNTDSASISPNGISLSRTTGAQTRQELFNSTTQYSGSKARQGMSLGMGAMGIARTLAQKQIAKATPDNANIQKNTPLINVFQGRFGFTFYDMAISGEMAEIIDSYFEMFGYATHKLKVPNFVNGGRPHWDYIKMQNAQIEPQTGSAGINSEALKIIEDIFNKGITLWADLAEVGAYNLNNHGN